MGASFSFHSDLRPEAIGRSYSYAPVAGCGQCVAAPSAAKCPGYVCWRTLRDSAFAAKRERTRAGPFSFLRQSLFALLIVGALAVGPVWFRGLPVVLAILAVIALVIVVVVVP